MYISSSPHIGSSVDTRILMGRVLIALTPVSIFGVVLFGFPVLLSMIVSVASAEIAEAVFRKIIRKDVRFGDCSAAVTGLLLTLVLPPGVPLWMLALGSAFAIIVAKEFFGGLGANVFNPALIGRSFLLMSFPVALTTWSMPKAFFPAGGFEVADVLGSATPLAFIKLGGTIPELGSSLAASGIIWGSDYWATIGGLFVGFRDGCIGESSILLILVGFLFLLLTGTIDWRAPVTMIISVFLFSFILGRRDPLVAVLTGGVLFGAVFMTTDYVTAPLTATGKLIFGFGAGLITVLIRLWGNYPDGVTYAILIMNAATPFLNKLLQKKYGYVKPKKTPKDEPAKGGAK
jgi:electron transport complex protein RnfD